MVAFDLQAINVYTSKGMCNESSFILYAALPLPDLKDCMLCCF